MYLLLYIIISVVGFTTQENIKITVYYESLCPASREFITEQLYPGYLKLGNESLTVEMMPFVSSIKKITKKENKWHLRCQHGEEECYANKVQACVLHLNATQDMIMKFMSCHMGMAQPELRSNIELKITKKENKWHLRCQHGEEECYANKVQACVLHLNATQDMIMKFMSCHMGMAQPELRSNIELCLGQSKLAWTDIQNCLKSDGYVYLAEYHAKAKKLDPPLKYVPHILFDDVDNEDIDAEVLCRNDFVSTVCLMYKSKIPKGCPSISG